MCEAENITLFKILTLKKKKQKKAHASWGNLSLRVLLGWLLWICLRFYLVHELWILLFEVTRLSNISHSIITVTLYVCYIHIIPKTIPSSVYTSHMLDQQQI